LTHDKSVKSENFQVRQLAEEIQFMMVADDLPVSPEVKALILNSADGLPVSKEAEAMIKRLYQEWGVYEYYWGKQ
jgi:hypothetical protein